jgi:hypothetical protein
MANEGEAPVEEGAWAERFQALLVRAEAVDVALKPQLSAALSILMSREIRMVFAGHFKSGKSTLLNAALGRPLLPTYSLPETGAACVLRAGEDDAVVVCIGEDRQALPCTTEALESAMALLSATGERRAEVGAIDSVEIRLTGSLPPPGVCWIDTPGINDTIAMDRRATEAARASDLLCWVLNSKQILAEVESAFLADHLAANGPGSVVFLLNVFLEQDDAATWQAYHARQIPRLCAKVADHAPEIGFHPAAPPPIVPVSARAVGTRERQEPREPDTTEAVDFGAAAMRGLLSLSGASAQARVRHTRCCRAAARIDTLAADLSRRWEVEKRRSDTAQAAWKALSRKREKLNKAYAAAVAAAVAACLTGFETDVETLRVALIAGVAANSHETPETLNQRINAALTAAAAAQADALLAALSDALQEAECLALKKAQQNQVRKLLTVEPICLEVPAAAIDNDGILASAGVGAVAAGIIPGLGHLVGGLIGAGVGYLKARSEAEHRHTAQWTTLVTEALTDAAERLASRRAALSAYLLKWGRPRQPLPAAPDTTTLHALTALRDTLTQTARELHASADEALLETRSEQRVESS